MKEFFFGTVILLFVAPCFLVLSEKIEFIIPGVLYCIFLFIAYNSKIGKEAINKIKEIINL